MTTPHDEGREAALAWMAGRLRFERLLADLHDTDGADVSRVGNTVITPVDEPTAEAA